MQQLVLLLLSVLSLCISEKRVDGGRERRYTEGGCSDSDTWGPEGVTEEWDETSREYKVKVIYDSGKYRVPGIRVCLGNTRAICKVCTVGDRGTCRITFELESRNCALLDRRIFIEATCGGDAYCQCDPHQYIRNISANVCKIVSQCASNPCKNGAECEDLDREFTCHCADGFTGTDCGTQGDAVAQVVSSPDTVHLVLLTSGLCLAFILAVLITWILINCCRRSSICKRVLEPSTLRSSVRSNRPLILSSSDDSETTQHSDPAANMDDSEIPVLSIPNSSQHSTINTGAPEWKLAEPIQICSDGSISNILEAGCSSDSHHSSSSSTSDVSESEQPPPQFPPRVSGIHETYRRPHIIHPVPFHLLQHKSGRHENHSRQLVDHSLEYMRKLYQLDDVSTRSCLTISNTSV